jgi:co-chaperonin GroES (HSP10)
MNLNSVKVIVPNAIAHSIDWQTANKSIRCIGQRVVVQMLPVVCPSNLLVPDSIKQFLSYQAGVVLWSPDEPVRVRGQYVYAPKPGTIVAVHPQDGVHIINAEMGCYTPETQIRVYGAYAEYVGQPMLCDWWESILAEGQIQENKDMEWKAFGDKIIFQKDKSVDKTAGGVYLPDGHHIRNEMAKVMSVGSLVDPEVRVGDRVSYNPHYVEQNGVEIGNGVIDFDYFIANELAINYVA